MSNLGTPLRSFEILTANKEPVMAMEYQPDRCNEDAGTIVRCKPNKLSRFTAETIQQRFKVLGEDMKQDGRGQKGGSTACVTLGRIVEDKEGEGSVKKAQTITLGMGDSFSILTLINEDGTFNSAHLLNEIHVPNPDDPRTKKEYERVMRDKDQKANQPKYKDGSWRLGNGLAMSRSYQDAPSKKSGHSEQPGVWVREILVPKNGRAVLVTLTDIFEPLSSTSIDPAKLTIIGEIVTKMLLQRESPLSIAKALIAKAREIYHEVDAIQLSDKISENEQKLARLKADDVSVEKKQIVNTLGLLRTELAEVNRLKFSKTGIDDGTCIVTFLDNQESLAGVFDGHEQSGSKTSICNNTIAAALAVNLPKRFQACFPELNEDFIESGYCTAQPQTVEAQPGKEAVEPPEEKELNKRQEKALELYQRALKKSTLAEFKEYYSCLGSFFNERLKILSDSIAKNENPQDRQEIAQILLLAKSGTPEMQYDVACWYGEQDKDAEAFQWFERSATNNGGFLEAWDALVTHYTGGIGVTQSFSNALPWYEKILAEEKVAQTKALQEKAASAIAYEETVKKFVALFKERNKDFLKELEKERALNNNQAPPEPSRSYHP